MLHVVLFEPEIPQNTGNIMRTCVASGCELHLIKPLGFSLEEKYIRRSGMDYRKDLTMTLYENWEQFRLKAKGQFYFITRYGKKAPSDIDFSPIEEDIYLVFGKESTGIPKEILRERLENCLRLPMVADARSLNLSNTVAIVVYEALRQKGYPGLETHETLKGEDWLTSDE